jgi:hypothetical protein
MNLKNKIFLIIRTKVNISIEKGLLGNVQSKFHIMISTFDIIETFRKKESKFLAMLIEKRFMKQIDKSWC